MPQPFEPDDELDVEVPLIRAYDFVDEPKPSLDSVIRMLGAGDLTGRRTETGTWRVPSISQFDSEIRAWVEKTGYVRLGGSSWTAVPDGYVAITKFCRDTVSPTIGVHQRLFAGTTSGKVGQPTLSGHARRLIEAEDIDSAMKVAEGIWVAKPVDLKLWLNRRFGIRI